MELMLQMFDPSRETGGDTRTCPNAHPICQPRGKGQLNRLALACPLEKPGGVYEDLPLSLHRLDKIAHAKHCDELATVFARSDSRTCPIHGLKEEQAVQRGLAPNRAKHDPLALNQFSTLYKLMACRYD